MSMQLGMSVTVKLERLGKFGSFKWWKCKVIGQCVGDI